MIASDTANIALPNDIAILHRMVQQLLSDVNEKTRQIVDLQNQLEWFKRHVFGRHSEKLDANPLTLFEGVTQAAPRAEDASAEAPERPARVVDQSGQHRNGCRPICPASGSSIIPPKEELICSGCGQTKQIMGEEITEEPDHVPASFIVRQHVRFQYACRHCQEGVVSGQPNCGIDAFRLEVVMAHGT